MKKAYLIHGWDGSPDNNWFPWLKKELEVRDFEVIVPELPGTENPIKSVWLKTMQDLVKNPDNNTYLIGHSMGCQAIQRYLESLEGDIKIGGAIFVAGWINDPTWEGRTEEEAKVVHDWFDVPKNYESMRTHCDNFVSIFSTDDPFILKPNWNEAKQFLDSSVVVLENKGHFDDEAGVKELPEALQAILDMSK